MNQPARPKPPEFIDQPIRDQGSNDRWRRWVPTWLLAALCYIPALAAHPGKLPSDTKLYLYLDPGGLLRQAARAWDPTQYGGWVPHQTISYLWPSGPWYWTFDKLGVPDWIAQRLWIATLLFCAGLGARWLAKLLGLRPPAATIVGLFYMLSPYVLPYISRTSIMLLPYAGLCWLVGLTIKAATGSSWRAPALFALVMCTVSATNFTAIVMVAPGPVLWLIDAAWRRTISWRALLVTAVKLGALSTVVCLWWIVMLTIQSKHGANVLGFSETLQAVSLTSLSTETLRGLGYWLFYIRDIGGPATSASFAYLTSSLLMIVSLLVLLGGFAGLTVTRWAARRYAAMLVLVGTVLAVSVHPIGGSSPLTTPLANASRSGLALSLRSSTRALPLSVLGLALGWGALVTVLTTRSPSGGRTLRWQPIVVPLVAGILAVGNLPALFTGDLADPAISHAENPPSGWTEAAAALSATGSAARVLQLPGAPFGAYRWGYTVDPVLPGLTAKPFMVRDLLPLGSPGAMDLLYAIDNRFQSNIAEAASIAPVARLLGADSIFSPNDVAFDRFRTPRPEITNQILTTPNVGLGTTTGYGAASPNTPVVASIDEDELSNTLIGSPLPTTTITTVNNPIDVIRAKTNEVVVAGSADGVIDAAAAGLIDGTQLVRYAYDVAHPTDPAVIATGSPSLIIVTDSNRDRAQQWRSSRDVNGFTEDGTAGGGVAVFDSADARLDVFAKETSGDQTVALQRGGLTATASAYGEPFAYRPEDRAFMAVDGDVNTAWRVADRAPADGQFITVTGSKPMASLTLRQPNDSATNRWITSVSISFDHGKALTFGLDETSKSGAGQAVSAPAAFTTATITITSTSTDSLPSQFGQSSVGFASITAADANGLAIGPTTEVVRPPTTLAEMSQSAAAKAGITAADTALAFVFTRDRVAGTDRWRSDPEPTMTRILQLDRQRQLVPAATVRLDPRADDSVIAKLFGGVDLATADQRLTGVPKDGGYAATDGDPKTAWVTSFGHYIGQQTSGTLTVPLDPAATIDHLTIKQSSDTRLATITSVTVAIGGQSATVDVPAPDSTGASTIHFAPMSGTSLSLTIAGTDAKTTIDRRSAEPTAVPVAISELSGPGISAHPLPATLDSGCRTDLLKVDATPIGIDVRATTADLLAGKAVTAELCGSSLGTLAPGEHIVASAAGSTTGLDVDRVVLSSVTSRAAAPAKPDPATPTVSHSATHNGHLVTVDNCSSGCWLTNGEGFEAGWTATSGGHSLGAPTQVDGGFNGWWLPPGPATRTVMLAFGPQRTLDIALLLTLIALLGCAGLAAFAGRRERSSFQLAAPTLQLRPSVAGRWPLVWCWLATTAIAALVISPKWGVIAFVVSGVALFITRRPPFLAVAGLGGLGLIAVRMLWVLRDVRPAPDPLWTSFFENLHRPALFVVVLLMGSALLNSDDPGERDESAERGDRAEPS